MLFSTLRRLLCAVAFFLLMMGSESFAQKRETSKSPGELLPAETVLYLRVDGSDGHEEAFEQTAAYAALYDSGLMDVVNDALATLGEDDETAGIAGIIEHLRAHGFSFSLAVDAPEGKPFEVWATVVVPFAGPGLDLLAEVLPQLSKGKIEVEQTRIKKRVVKYVKLHNPLFELAWWQQGENLILTAGMNSIANSMAVADETRPNIESHPLWDEYSTVEDDFDVTQIGWFDITSLRAKFGEKEIPNPRGKDAKSITVNQILEALGLHNLEHAAMLSGYRGECIWTEALISAPGERTGLLSLLDQPSFQVEDLPAMPLNHSGILAFSFDGAKAYVSLLQVVRDVLAFAPEGAAADVDNALEKFEEKMGFKPETLLASLGSLHCVYSDSAQSPFGLGTVGLIQVKDEAVLVECVRKILTLIQTEANRDGSSHVEVDELLGGESTLFRMRFPEVSIFNPTFSIGEEWLIIGLIPQAVDAELMRLDGTLFSWSITDDLGDALEQLPEQMTSLQVVDPAGTYKLLLGLAPTILSLMEQGLIQKGEVPEGWRLPVDVSAIPPAELVVQPLFMNVAVTTVDADRWHAFSRQSLPGFPLAGGAGGPSLGLAFSAIGAAILVPAVAKARDAAQRTVSRNNLKSIGLAIHTYAAENDSLPNGTIPNDQLEPGDRLSWLVSVLPYLDESDVFNEIDRKAGWEAEENKNALTAIIPTFLNPSHRDKGDGLYGKSNYVGLAGLGEDGPTLPVTNRRAGAFGYDRVTKLKDFRDGTSNTIMVSDTTDTPAWGQGGPATIRPLTQQPYINGPDGLGSNNSEGMQVLMGDGSVRFLSTETAPETIEALVTINGGERVDDF